MLSNGFLHTLDLRIADQPHAWLQPRAAAHRRRSERCAEAWLFRDDIGAPHGIKGYEEQVNSVGMHHGHNHFPSEITWNTFNSVTYLYLHF